MKKGKQVIIGQTNYKLIETIGNGGSGVVWKAESNATEYAIKFILSDNPNKIERFKSEIVFCKTSNHKNIIRIIAYGEYNDKPCYVMPLYPQTFKDLINTEKDQSVLISFILKLCGALKYIHGKCIFHRDIKPENILIKGKELVLADFGIAHFKSFKLTKKGDLLANRNYAAPEQKKKGNADNITEAADIFALGLIINECFTKEYLSGSDFKLISDTYPLYAELDSLVSNMIRQEPEDRPSIDSIITEMKFIHNKIKQSLEDVANVLRGQVHLSHIKHSVFKNIIRTASEDILFGKMLFESKSVEELNKYNHNWHMKIGYRVDDFLFNLYVQERIHTLCKAKFEYESNQHTRSNWYKALDLENDEKDKLIYEQINNILSKYKLQKKGEFLFDLSGEILKYFSSCAHYHCKEIFKSIQQVEDLAIINLKNTPIISIVQTLKTGIIQNIEYLLNGINGLGGRYDFNFMEHISISLERTENYLLNDDDTELFDIHYQKSEIQIQKILSKFKEEWKVSYNKIDEEKFSIKFTTYKQYEKFRKYALELSRPHYIFEGDVIDILKHPNLIGNMVELKLNRTFDIPDTIAKIVGYKELNE